MRLIDADKLVKTPIDTTDIPINKCLDVVLLEDLESAPTVCEWIPVSEALPIKDQVVLDIDDKETWGDKGTWDVDKQRGW